LLAAKPPLLRKLLLPLPLLILLLLLREAATDLYTLYPTYTLAALVTRKPLASISRLMVWRRACTSKHGADGQRSKVVTKRVCCSFLQGFFANRVGAELGAGTARDADLLLVLPRPGPALTA
jgi:hypothetical protein